MPRHPRSPLPLRKEIEVVFTRSEKIGDALIARVAERCNVSEKAIKAWLASDDTNDRFLQAFEFYGVSLPSKHRKPIGP